MYYDKINETEPVIRKSHHCAGCGVKYPIGTKMVNTVGKFDGQLQNSYWCYPCNNFLREHWQDLEEGIAMGDVFEFPDYKEYREQYNDKNGLIDPLTTTI
jgi:hypothetical protein